MTANAPTVIEREPRVLPWRLWTPALIQLAEARADAGYLQQAADLCEFLASDDRAKGVLDARGDALFGLPLTFESGLGRSRKKALRALEAEEDWWVGFPEATCKQLFWDGIMLGIGVAQVVWVEHAGRLVPVLHRKHPRNLEYDYESRTWKLTVADDGGTTRKVPIVAGDGGWFIYTPGGSPHARPWAHGAFRALSAWILAKRDAKLDWAAYCERHGLGILALIGFDGTKEQREEIEQRLRSMGHRAGIVLGKDQELKIVEAVANTWQAYKSIIQSADEATMIALRGNNLTTDVSAGSQAAATVHAAGNIAQTRSDGETWSTQIHDQVLTWYTEFNWGNGDAAPWPVYGAEPAGDLQARATSIQLFAQALSTLKTAGVAVDVAALAEEFDVPLLKEETS